VRPRDIALAGRLDQGLRSFERLHPLPGIQDPKTRAVFLEQLLESIHRVIYPSVILRREISDLRADPSSELFDPVKAAELRKRQGNNDEAFWLIFLFVHFGKSLRSGWRLVRDVYAGQGIGARWDWPHVSSDVNGFRQWLADNQARLKQSGRFGNHRKYESLNAWKSTGTGEAVASYVAWVAPPRSHVDVIELARKQAADNPRTMFDLLYRSMHAVTRFGRTARFDYLTMVGKLGLATIEPGSTYMEGATGPYAGGCLLFGGRMDRSTLDRRLMQLGDHLSVGMQVLEDALCNWQKAPTQFVRFRG